MRLQIISIDLSNTNTLCQLNHLGYLKLTQSVAKMLQILFSNIFGGKLISDEISERRIFCVPKFPTEKFSAAKFITAKFLFAMRIHV